MLTTNPIAMYPNVKVRAAEVDDDYELSVIPLQDFNSLSIRDISPEKECKHLFVAKIPRSYIPRSITPPPSLPKATKKSEQQAEHNGKPYIRASSIPRPRAVMSSPDNDQILGNRKKVRLQQLSPLRNQNTVQYRHSAQSKPSSAVRKPSKTAAKLEVTAHTSDIAKGKNESTVDIRVPRANIAKTKPCFKIT